MMMLTEHTQSYTESAGPQWILVLKVLHTAQTNQHVFDIIPLCYSRIRFATVSFYSYSCPEGVDAGLSIK
jgi:hypothetical protein